MRHFCLTIAITALACGMTETPRQSRLIALTRLLQGLGACQLGTITGTIALSAVAAAADQYRRTAAGA